MALSQWPEVADHCRLVKAVAAEQVDVFPQQRREMRPRVVGDMLADAREMFGGSREVAGVPHNDTVDDKAQGRSAVELERWERSAFCLRPLYLGRRRLRRPL